MGSSQSGHSFKPEAAAVELYINEKRYSVSRSLPADTSLNTFIREHAHLPGTKFMCLEGGCGTCIVSVKSADPTNGKDRFYSVNSCLIPVFACHGWSVTTVEGLGNKRQGYHKIQSTLAAGNGTQCGYCSAGMVMNMNSLLQSKPTITMKEVENSFGGNICRCTGYRPILDSFKSLASDAPPHLVQKIADIEDMICPKNGTVCNGKNGCGEVCGNGLSEIDWPASSMSSLYVKLKDNTAWLKPTNVKEIFEIFDQIGDQSYRLVGGNTGQGVYRWKKNFQYYIDINGVAELHTYQLTGDGLQLGANMSLTKTMAVFNKLSVDHPNRYSYLKVLANHIDLIANVPVRNVGTLAGNLSLKHMHKDFPSDIFLILETVNAHLVIDDKSGVEKQIGLLEYLETDMHFKIVKKIVLPPYDSSYHIRTFKIMARAQNTHAYVNAGFSFKADKKNQFFVLQKPRIVFGGIRAEFTHAVKTENYLEGKQLLNPRVLQGALGSLDGEISPHAELPEASPQYRKGLAISLFYKYVLSLDSSKVDDLFKSGGEIIQRPLSSGKQTFETDPSLWPLNKPMPKLEAFMQCSGEAEYINDMPSMPGELWAQIALADRLATISKIDPSEALKLPGVWGFYSAKDIPGQNSFLLPNGVDITAPELIFVEEGKEAQYAGQAVGVVLANSRMTAMKAADLVKITYTNERKPIMDVWDIVANGPKDRIKLSNQIDPSNTKNDVKYEFEGKWNMPHQYHFTMETHTCVAVPSENQLDVYPATQGPASIQQSIGNALAIPENHINIRVRRLGGGYGCKLTRCNHAAVVASMAAYLSRKPVRFVLSMEHNMRWAGKRFPVHSNYKVGVNENGEIQYLTASLYQDSGCSPNDSASPGSLVWMKSLYDAQTWNVKSYEVTTDTPSNTWCRAPGSTEGIALIETVMDHIAHYIKKDPIEVRFANVDPAQKEIVKPIIDGMIESTDYQKRVQEVQQFNSENRWRKRGISIVPISYQFDYFSGFHGVVSIYGMDGTVVVSHGAIEMGQGVNTKVAQVVAHSLGIEVDLISVKPTYNMISPNDLSTGGSLGSESVAFAVSKCCEQLNARLEPTKSKLGPNAKWKEIINQAYADAVDLMATYYFTTRDEVKSYLIYGVTVAEVEIDLLTGNYIARRVDVLEDAGQSMSPEIDVGQVEGAFIMGMGYYMTEEVVLDPSTGLNLTDRTWNYRPPGAKDIPVDFRVSLMKNSKNLNGVFRSKATGEPPFCMSCAVPMAVRNAVLSARMDAGSEDKWLEMDPPCTPEKIWLSCLTKKEQMVLHKSQSD